MNTIKQLIDKYCPDGVEYKKLGEVCNINRGVRVVRKDLQLEGEIPVYQNSLMPLGYFNKSNCPKESVYVISAGAAGDIGYSQIPFWAADDCLFFENLQGLQQKFIYYYLCSRYKFIKAQVRRASVPRLSRTVIENMTIPVPPLPVQREIVRILDSFTSLEAELEAELEARRKQYEYYRDQLLSFKHLSGGGKNEVEWKTIKDVCLSICSGGTPNTQNKDFYNGNIPWLRTQEVDWKDIYKTDVLITEAGLKNSSAKLIPANCVIVAMYGATAAKVAINKIPLTTNQACCNLQIDESICNNRYVYQWLCKNYEVLKAMGEGSQQNLNAKKIKNFPIPIPPLSTQRRIVSILDRFESLVNDITTGLPAEITARHQQYEYYRDQLLSFKRKS